MKFSNLSKTAWTSFCAISFATLPLVAPISAQSPAPNDASGTTTGTTREPGTGTTGTITAPNTGTTGTTTAPDSPTGGVRETETTRDSGNWGWLGLLGLLGLAGLTRKPREPQERRGADVTSRPSSRY